MVDMWIIVLKKGYPWWFVRYMYYPGGLSFPVYQIMFVSVYILWSESIRNETIDHWLNALLLVFWGHSVVLPIISVVDW